jgi:hypothetical protein
MIILFGCVVAVFFFFFTYGFESVEIVLLVRSFLRVLLSSDFIHQSSYCQCTTD